MTLYGNYDVQKYLGRSLNLRLQDTTMHLHTEYVNLGAYSYVSIIRICTPRLQRNHKVHEILLTLDTFKFNSCTNL